MTMTAEQTPRQNRYGSLCPPWCVTDHETPWSEAGYTFTFHGSDWARVEVAGRDKTRPPGEVTVQAVSYGQAGMEPAVIVVHDNRLAADGRGRLDLSGGDAVQLAGLIETLAKATPAEHRQLAAAIREAAALITETAAADDSEPCPGCVGRGTGARCCVCDRPVPPGLRRQSDDPPEYRQDCADCASGRAHVHGGAS